MSETRLWSRDEVAAAIVQGDTLVIHHGRLLRIPDTWLKQHPGGQLAILHFIGRDASGEMDAFHSRETLDKRMKYFVVGSVDVEKDGWQPLMPPITTGWVRKLVGSDGMQWVNEADSVGKYNEKEILLVKKDSIISPDGPLVSVLQPPPTLISPAVQHQHTLAYRQLHELVESCGLYETPYLSGYGPDVLRYVLFGTVSALAYQKGWFIPSSIFLGLMWHQLTFTAHDLGHCGVTHDWVLDRILGIIIADLVGGISIGWWVDNHNIHHLVTNHPSHDPDIQHIPFFAISPKFFDSLWSTYYNRTMQFDVFSKFVIRFQPYLYYIILSLARFNLYANSYVFLLKSNRGKWRGAEIASLAVFWVWFGAVLYGCPDWWTRIAYLLISHIVTSPVHIQIVQSHFARSTVDLGPGESFPDRQLRTTTDILCSPSLEWVHGGLHLQVTHHLFPRLPRHNLKRASELVKAFATQQGLEYAEMGFVKCNTDVLGVLHDVASQVDVFCKVAAAEAQGNLSQGH